MKRILILPVFIFTIIAARADLTIQNQSVIPATTNYIEIKARRESPSLQKQLVSPAITNEVTTKIKGGKIRRDNEMEDRSSIIDLKTFEATILLHQKKEAVQQDAQKLKQWAKKMAKAANVEAPKAYDAGKAETVVGYDAEIYTWTNTGGAAGTWWVAKNFPNFSKIKKDLARLDELRADEGGKGMEPDQSTLPGVVIKAQWGRDAQMLTMTLVSIKEESLPATVFEIPRDYHTVTSP